MTSYHTSISIYQIVTYLVINLWRQTLIDVSIILLVVTLAVENHYPRFSQILQERAPLPLQD
jgi:hypothetical protein